MATVNKTTQKTDKLPKPPKDKKPPKSWIAKRLDNLQRTLRAATTLHERFEAVRGENRAEFAEVADSALDRVRGVKEELAEALVEFNTLAQARYAPRSEVRGVKLENGSQVWLRAKVWSNKYANLYTPAELDGLAIVRINGKKALAKSVAGITVVESVGSFTTRPVAYEAPGAS